VTLGYTIAISCWIIMIWPHSYEQAAFISIFQHVSGTITHHISRVLTTEQHGSQCFHLKVLNLEIINFTRESQHLLW